MLTQSHDVECYQGQVFSETCMYKCYTVSTFAKLLK